ncbi:MAG: cyclopropane-fatty-acyl-phospholipid synthase family protein [Roseiarcus sp.]|uniref:class I SAM-dependent methyltransferase n=1 Tax=Roseiarcus sp. TaxID=1969460 RepID=UPI003C41EA6D
MNRIGSRRRLADLRSLLVRAVVARLTRRVEVGELTIQLPSGERVRCSGREPGPVADIHFLKWRTIMRVAVGGDVGLAASYCDGEWMSSDLPALIEWGARNGDQFMDSIKGMAPTLLLNRVVHRLRANTRSGSRRNVVAHYDLGNEFYRLWLDRTMTYSSAIFPAPDATLEQAQETKFTRIIDRLKLNGGESVLEIGGGWGALAAAIAKARDARVTSLTVSPAQLSDAEARARNESIAEKIQFKLMDYRDVGGVFDRIVSIEMIEAVGKEYLPKYFETIRNRMRPGGLCVLQAITIAEDRFASYCSRPDFIQRYIFPGGFLPSKTYMREVLEAHGLKLLASDNFGDSYALTVREWRRRFLAAWPQIEKMGFQEPFRRLWEFYLSYCEGGFRAGVIDVGLYSLAHAETGAEALS